MPARLLLLTLLAGGLSGCVQVTAGPQGVGVVRERSVCWTWGDWNTLRSPAWFVERVEDLPPSADRVRYYRWLHGAGVADPLAPPLPTTTYEPPLVAVVLEAPVVEEVEPPPLPELVPPPEETAPLPPSVLAVPQLPATLVSGESG